MIYTLEVTGLRRPCPYMESSHLEFRDVIGAQGAISLSGNTHLSFVFTSYIRHGVRAALKFGKRASLFLYHKDKKYV